MKINEIFHNINQRQVLSRRDFLHKANMKTIRLDRDGTIAFIFNDDTYAIVECIRDSDDPYKIIEFWVVDGFYLNGGGSYSAKSLLEFEIIDEDTCNRIIDYYNRKYEKNLLHSKRKLLCELIDEIGLPETWR